MQSSITFAALAIEQPIGSFFIGVMDYGDLSAISFADVRRLESESRDVEKYLGIQRGLNKQRVKEISAYVTSRDATFPTSVILAVEAKCAQWDAKNSRLTLSAYEAESEDEVSVPFDKIAKILDGQHRVAGLADYSGGVFQVNVAVFVDADISEQANVFATVNLAQTKVNKSLVYDLFELARARSPQKTCHNVAVALNDIETSPLYHRIKRLGIATEGRFTETITQATFVESLLPYLSPNPSEDRDILIRGKTIGHTEIKVLQKCVFRNLFVTERDDEISQIIWNYFEAVAQRWPQAWNNFERGNILIKTNGFRALMRFLRPCYLSLTSDIGIVIESERFHEVFAKVHLEDSDFNVTQFQPGTSGEAALLRKLKADSGLG